MTKQRTRKEMPIIFSAPMVRAILEGRKTVTRRIVKWPAWANAEDAEQQAALVRDRALAFYRDGRAIKTLRCPFGAPGSQLWVREQFSYSYGTGVEDRSPCWYWADGQPDYGDWSRPVPSIHMPRWASRITLEVTGVRVERLNSISREDVLAEGCQVPRCQKCGYTRGDCLIHMDHHLCGEPTPCHEVSAYRELWESINGTGSWDENPWVWVVEFRRVP